MVNICENYFQGIPFFITKVVSRISTELTRLHKIGFRRFAVTNLEPAGCLPVITISKNMNNCSRRDNVLSSVHNRFLSQTLVTLRTFRGRNSKYLLLDQYNSFLEVLSSSSKYGNISLSLSLSLRVTFFFHCKREMY